MKYLLMLLFDISSTAAAKMLQEMARGHTTPFELRRALEGQKALECNILL